MNTRREFLTGAVAGMCAAGGKFTLSGAEKESGKMKFGFCTWNVEMTKTGKDVGYDFIEMTVGAALGPDKDGEWWKRRRDELAAMALPLRSCNGFIPGSFRLTGPKADHEPALKYAEIAMRRAAEAGVNTLVFGSGGARNVPGDYCAADRKDWPDVQKGRDQYVDFCRELCRRTADLGEKTCVVVEPLCPNESNIVNFVWQGVQICEEVASPRLKELADLYHMMAGHESAESIVKAGALLKHCHIAEFGTRQYPGCDEKLNAKYEPYFAALKKIGYTGGVSCECGWGDGKELGKKLETALATMKAFSH